MRMNFLFRDFRGLVRRVSIPDEPVVVSWVDVVQLNAQLLTAMQLLHQSSVGLLQHLRVW